MNTTRTRKRVAGLALAAVAAAAAYGITATGVDFASTPDDEDAATAIEYGLIAALAQAHGFTFNAID